MWITPDASPHHVDAYVMGQPDFVERGRGRALEFSGHDDWIELYRHPHLKYHPASSLSIEFWVRPERLDMPNTFLTKSRYQYGLVQPHPDSLEFYVHTGQRVSAATGVPEDWYENWHHVAGVYDGRQLSLYIDYQRTARVPCSGAIRHAAYPLCLGRDAERHDQGEFSGRLSAMRLDDVRLYDTAVDISDLRDKNADKLAEAALLSLDFESDHKTGSFYSTGLGGRTYGIVWPDRQPQPELMQIKHSAQPVRVEMLDPEKQLVRVSNRHHFKNLNELDCRWELLRAGESIDSGQIQFDLPPRQSTDIRAPFSLPTPLEGAEYILTLSFCLRKSTDWAQAGHEVAWEQLIIRSVSTMDVNSSAPPLNITEQDDKIILSGERFEYEMNRKLGQFVRMIYKKFDLLQSAPRYRVWRAPLANSMDPWGSQVYGDDHITPGRGRSIENQLRTLGLDRMRNRVDTVKIAVLDSAIRIEVQAYSLGSGTSGFERRETWTVRGDGRILLRLTIVPRGAMPEHLPKSGLELRLPQSMNRICWYGRGPFETFPDRKTGAKIGVYESTAEQEIVPYLIPQDYGNLCAMYAGCGL
ncbi:MAG: beta-galactosidase domain 4-containing protein [candidate division KSB1 bacterium]|nr:beta-galactosidase domain 4-containing protein [candidate division KSB1 bacterium]